MASYPVTEETERLLDSDTGSSWVSPDGSLFPLNLLLVFIRLKIGISFSTGTRCVNTIHISLLYFYLFSSVYLWFEIKLGYSLLHCTVQKRWKGPVYGVKKFILGYTESGSDYRLEERVVRIGVSVLRSVTSRTSQETWTRTLLNDGLK